MDFDPAGQQFELEPARSELAEAEQAIIEVRAATLDPVQAFHDE